MTKISTVICYCSNEKRFIDDCINAVRPFSHKVMVSVGDHFFDGTPEDIELLEQHQKDHPDVDFLVFEWQFGEIPRYWHNYARLIGASKVKEDCDWVLFIDADEVIETALFTEFIKKLPEEPSVNSYKLANYWYFREPYYRADEIEDSIVLVRSEYSTSINIYDKYKEREQFEFYNTPRKTMLNDQPMAHHYSWVRTKEEMLQKVKAWGHTNDKNWPVLVEEEFSRDFNGKSFLNNYTFKDIRDVS